MNIPSSAFGENLLGKDLNAKVVKRNSIELNINFTSNGFRDPPFVRVVGPKFAFHTGHVTVGGSICTEELTPQGWKSDTNSEELILHIFNLFLAGEGRLACIVPSYHIKNPLVGLFVELKNSPNIK